MRVKLPYLSMTALILAIVIATVLIVKKPCLNRYCIEDDMEELAFDIGFTEKKLLKNAIDKNDKIAIEQFKYCIERYKEAIKFLKKNPGLKKPYLCLVGYSKEAMEINNDTSVAISVRFYEKGFDVVGIKIYYNDSKTEQAFCFPIINSDEYLNDIEKKEIGSSALRFRGITIETGTNFHYDEQTGIATAPIDILLSSVELSVYDKNGFESNRLELKMYEDVKKLILSQREKYK